MRLVGMGSGAGQLREKVEFQQRNSGADAFGGQFTTWAAQFEAAAEFSHLGGGEGVEAARIAGREVYKVKVRSNAQTRTVTADGWRIHETRLDRVFNIISVDAITDQAWVWLRAEA